MPQWTTRAELEHQVVMLSRQGVSRRATARALSVSRNTVRKILKAHGLGRLEAQSALAIRPRLAPRPTKLDSYKGDIAELLERYPAITAQRVFEELRAVGFTGGYTAVKKQLRHIRPKRKPEPSLPTPVHGPGKMGESDWSSYVINFTNSGRSLIQVFNYVLAWSTRKRFRVYERADMHALMDGHQASFERFGGAAEECKYDCQKAVVLGWEGQQPLYNPRFLAFATHYEFRPRACRPGHPNDKPRTERSFWEFEQSFLNGRSFRDVEDMRAQLDVWHDTTCDVRPHRRLKQSRMELFAQEQPHLVPLPAHPYDTARVVYRVCSIDGFISYDGNRYAVPYEHVTDILPVRVTQHELFIYAADLRLVARRELAPRGAGHDVNPPGTHQSSRHRSGADMDQLKAAFGAIGETGELFFAGLAAAQGRGAGHHARQILLLRERYSTADIGAALAHARAFGAFEHAAVARILEARAAPRQLAEYVAEDIARRLNEPPGDDTYLHDLDEYDSLPAQGTKEPPCPDASRQPPTSSPSDSGDTSSF